MRIFAMSFWLLSVLLCGCHCSTDNSINRSTSASVGHGVQPVVVDEVNIKLETSQYLRGDVKSSSGGKPSLSAKYSLTLTETETLKVRQIAAMASCGAPTVAFSILKGDSVISTVTIDPSKTYASHWEEVFGSKLGAGTYTVNVTASLGQACSAFYYQFCFMATDSTATLCK